MWKADTDEANGVMAPRASGPDQNNDDDVTGGTGTGTGTVVKARPKTKKPSMYRVHVLERFFNKSREAATEIMLHVHHRGVGVCGVYTYEVAETKVTQTIDFARRHQHPLQCTMEKE
jgi:ATP-dependent Clp protease adaptor protein ClpS